MAELNPEEMWKVLQEQADEDAWLEQQVSEVVAMSDAALDDELRGAGITREDVEKQASALYAKMTPTETASKVVALASRQAKTSRRRPVAAWVAAAASAAAVTGGLLYTALQEGLPAHGRPDAAPSTPPSVQAPADLAAAAELRKRAGTALDQGHADECLRLLDDARKLDPEGDQAPDVVRLRERALAARPPR